MEIRDPIHGSIHILKEEIPIISHPFFQRLRNIKQLGFSEYIFPGATHTRFIHSIGVMNIGEKAFDTIFKDFNKTPELLRLKKTFKLACLLHDIGHAPLSHSTESVMPALSKLKIDQEYLRPQDIKNDRQATHEDYTLKSIIDSSFSESFNHIYELYGVERKAIADIIRGSTNNPKFFTINNINYFPILHQLTSGELDCDRMDYLLRDSYFCGVSYGKFDLDWILDNLDCCVINNKAYLGISQRSILTFEDFLLSRYHMFIMVYFHYRAVCLEKMLSKYFKTASKEYEIPANIEDYQNHDDNFIMKILKKSENQYAKLIIKNIIPEKIYESFNEKELTKLTKIQNYLEENNIEYIRCSSSGRLSRYYTSDNPASNEHYSIKVIRKNTYENKVEYSEISDATDLFQKFSKSHAINRLHCHLSSLCEKQKKALFKYIEAS